MIENSIDNLLVDNNYLNFYKAENSSRLDVVPEDLQS